MRRSVYTFWWAYGGIRAANARGQLTEQDLAHLPAADQPARLLERFRTRWADGAQTSPQRVLVSPSMSFRASGTVI